MTTELPAGTTASDTCNCGQTIYLDNVVGWRHDLVSFDYEHKAAPAVDPSRVADITVAHDAWRVAKIRHRANPTHDTLAIVERRWETYADACDRIAMCLASDCITLGCTAPAHTLPADAITSTCADCGERIWWAQADPRVRIHTETRALACPVT